MDEFEITKQIQGAVQPPKTTGKRRSVWLLLLLLIAFALRIFLLDAQSIWWDEGISLHLATSPLNEIGLDRLDNIHPPLYFILLKGWLTLTGVSAFTARYLSVLVSWLQVAVIFAISRRWFGMRTGIAAVILATFSAVSIIYGQEIRVYAMLALNYLLLLAVTRELTRLDSGRSRRRLWIVLGLLMWLGLHLHYISIFVIAYVSIWALLSYIRQRRWVSFRRWLLVLFLTGLASFPWFLAVVGNWRAVVGEAAAGTFTTEPTPISFLISQIWVFHLTGLAGALAQPGMDVYMGTAVVLLLLLLIIRIGQKSTRWDTIILLAHWLVPLCSALLVWTIRSFSHPRYVSMFAPGLILLAAYVTFPSKDNKRRRLLLIPNLLSISLFLLIFFGSLWGLWLYFVNPDVAKDDVRGVAHYLEETAEASDLILIPDTDWSFPFEYAGEAKVGMPGLDNPVEKWRNLERMTAGVDRVHLMDYVNGTRDWQHMLPFALGKAGLVESEREFNGLVVRTYLLSEGVIEPILDSEAVDFGPIVLAGSWIEQDGFAGDGAVVALSWILSEPIDQDVHISLRLLDSAGWPVASMDRMLVDENGRPSRQWQVDQPVMTYHVIPVSPATPPLAYDLELQVYTENGSEIVPLSVLDDQGAPVRQSSIIGKSHVTYEQSVQLANQEELQLEPWSEPIQLVPGLMLLAAEVPTGPVSAGDLFNIRFLWQATAEQMPGIVPEIALVQEKLVLSENIEAPVYGQYPISAWSRGEQIYERRILTIPADAAGQAMVILRAGEDEYDLGWVEILAGEHSFVLPESEYQADSTFGELARLTGFNIPNRTISSGDTIPLTLVWQSLGGNADKDYIVFVHLLDEDGRLAAQHDGPPANGSKRTNRWVAEEYIIDDHEMMFLDSEFTGRGRIEIGFYDPNSGERVLLPNGTDHYILPVDIIVE